MQELAEKHAKIAEAQGYDRKMAWDDGRAAITYVRKNAAKYGVNPHAIGIIGFSAGGNIVYHVALDHDEMSRPDFLGMIYPAWFENQVPDDPMPLFIAASTGEASSANGFGDTPALYNAWNQTVEGTSVSGVKREDLNARSSFRFLALTTRVGLDIKGYQVGRTLFEGKVEADFYAGLSGSSSPNLSIMS